MTDTIMVLMDAEGWTLTPELRWRKGLLLQKWVRPVRDMRDAPELDFEWRPVPEDQ